jgi:hypothetical protein
MNYLSLYTYMHEQGHPDAVSKQVPYPFGPSGWHSLSNDGGQDIFARFSIHLCLHPDKAGSSELYNIADEATPRSFVERWPIACALFGLEGVPPVEISSPQYCPPVKFIRKYADQVKLLKHEKGVTLQSVVLEDGIDTRMERFYFNHDMVIEKARATGFLEEMPYQDGWRKIIERYERAKKAYLGR